VADIEVKGLPELSRSLDGLKGDLEDMTPMNGDVARDLVSAVRSRAPVRSGRLAGSFVASGSPDKASASSSLDYAGVQNYGDASHHIEGQHFAEDALAASAAGAEAKYREGVDKMCRKAER
jgi:hypothetical protein